MTRLRRTLCGLAIAVGCLLLFVLLVTLGFNVESDWRVHTAVALPPPAVELPTPGALPGSPVLIVNGSLDQRAVAQEASFLAVAAQASSHRFKQTPHGVSMLRSAEFAALVNGFTARLRSALPPA